MNRGPIEIREIDDLQGGDESGWDNYVRAQINGSFFHLSGWWHIYRQLGWLKPLYLIAQRNGTVVGVLPTAFASHGVGAKRLISAPFCVRGGALGDDDQVVDTLEAAAAKIGKARGANTLELRCLSSHPTDGVVDRRYVNFSRSLGESEDENLKQVPRKQRAMIRKGQAAGLNFISEIGLDDFVKLYSRSMRDLGTPRYTSRLFELLSEHFDRDIRICGAEYEGSLVATVLSFQFNRCVMPYYSGSLPIARKLKAYDFLYWRLLCDAFDRGFRQFDFGRSLVGSGAYAFKKNWGFEPTQLHYRHVSLDGGVVSPIDPDSKLNQLARRWWSRSPLFFANAIGPLLARRLV